MSFVSREWLEAKRQAAQPAGAKPLDLLFGRQLAVIADPSHFKILLCGRRAGKTDVIIKDFAHGMLAEPGSRNLFIALTIGSARELLWEPFRALNIKHGWGFKFDSNLHIVTHPNGSRLIVRGADDTREIEKLRGQRFRRVRIDECGAQRPSYLAYMVLEVLEAALMDDPRSDMWLAGTCTTQAFGFFYDSTTGKLPGWSLHSWTAEHNPYVDWTGFVYGRTLPDGRREQGLLERRGWDEHNPIFRREYLAQWVLDSQRLVFRFDPARNVVDRLPALRPGDHWCVVDAADFGVGHATAWGALAWPARWGRDAYLLESWQATGLAPSDAAVRIAASRAPYRSSCLIGDVNGLGKGFEREWNKLFPDVPMRAADKHDKRAALEIVSDRLYVARQSEDWEQRRGLFIVRGQGANDALCAQLATLQWDEERKDIAPGQDDDLAHMLLYAYRHCPAFANAAEDPPPEPVPTGPFDRFVQRKLLPKAKEDAISVMRGAYRRG